MQMAKEMGADVVLDSTHMNVVAEMKRLTNGGADVAIEALGRQQTFRMLSAVCAGVEHSRA